MEMIKYNQKYAIDPCGFINFSGANCYFNALLQSLLSCTSLNEIIENNITKENYFNNQVILKYYELIKNINDNKKNYNKISKYGMIIFLVLMNTLKGSNYINLSHGQQDANEGFYSFIHAINPERNFNEYKLYEIDNLFRHRYVSVIYCSDCDQCVSKKQDEYVLFELEPNIILKYLKNNEIKKENIIKEYITKQLSYTDNNYICPNCESKKKKNKLTNLIMIPEILVILIKDYNLAKMNKFNINVPFPKQIIFDKKSNNNEKLLYEPVAQIEHSGSMNSGHYWAICKRKDGWYLINDNSYRKSQFKPTSNTYMVFYHYIKNI